MSTHLKPSISTRRAMRDAPSSSRHYLFIFSCFLVLLFVLYSFTLRSYPITRAQIHVTPTAIEPSPYPEFPTRPFAPRLGVFLSTACNRTALVFPTSPEAVRFARMHWFHLRCHILAGFPVVRLLTTSTVSTALSSAGLSDIFLSLSLSPSSTSSSSSLSSSTKSTFKLNGFPHLKPSLQTSARITVMKNVARLDNANGTLFLPRPFQAPRACLVQEPVTPGWLGESDPPQVGTCTCNERLKRARRRRKFVGIIYGGIRATRIRRRIYQSGLSRLKGDLMVKRKWRSEGFKHVVFALVPCAGQSALEAVLVGAIPVVYACGSSMQNIPGAVVVRGESDMIRFVKMAAGWEWDRVERLQVHAAQQMRKWVTGLAWNVSLALEVVSWGKRKNQAIVT